MDFGSKPCQVFSETKKGFAACVLLFLLCRPVAAQNHSACQADLNHLQLPARAMLDVPIIPNGGGSPLTLLFSQDGIDAYSATWFRTIRMGQESGMPWDGSVYVLLVYQSEGARQAEIKLAGKMLRAWHLLPSVFPLSNMKFSVWRLKLTPVWVNNVLRRKWLVVGIAFFEPMSCEPDKLRTLASYQGCLEASVEDHNVISPAEWMIPELPTEFQGPAKPDSVLAKALAMECTMLRKYGIGDY